ncbi:hypothetical protein C9374_011815 [Naegleria lovaniensis]|uniref:Uncharacterized protein n=1 Tax=Naegleria lovaniensis TaxID=51637 RepID=A0AA88GGM4_NAELO|nr:uncharacterized protein C9374_011815 [Naegleria lovaniensis]KAG2373726.1 hypothetical protein C9374_011815 [Naegleria lovaniensis]
MPNPSPRDHSSLSSSQPDVDERIIYLPNSIFNFHSTQTIDDVIGFPIGQYLIIIGIALASAIVLILVVPSVLSFVILCIVKCTVNTDRYQKMPNAEVELAELSTMGSSFLNQYSNMTSLRSGWQRSIHSRVFDTTSKDCCWLLLLVITWIPRKLCWCGLLEACCVLRLTRYHVRNMRVGNRRLDLDISNDCNVMTCVSVMNHLMNFYTCGLWTALGLMHHFFYSKLDQRLMWRDRFEDQDPAISVPIGTRVSVTHQNPEMGNRSSTISTTVTHQKIIWYETGATSFRWFSAYCGEYIELTHWFFTVLNILLFGCLGPFIKAWYLRHRMRHVTFGGKGEFVLADEVTDRVMSRIEHSPNRIMLRSELQGCDLFVREFFLRILNFLTLGLFGCLFGDSFILSFMDDHVRVVTEM